MTRRVLVTGAGGKTGRAVMAALGARGGQPVAFVRDPARVADLDVPVAVGDQRSRSDLVAALAGVGAVYAIAPNMSLDEVAMGEAVVAACREADVPRLVYHSVAHPQLTAMPHHADKGRVEERVIESGLTWTILQPNAYLQNLGGYLDGIRAGVYSVPYAIDRPSAMVDVRDVAEVAAATLVDDVGRFATFELSGPQLLTPRDIAATADAFLGREVVAERQDPDDWLASAAGVPAGVRERLHAMFRHYDRHGSPGDGTVLAALLARLTGRAPRNLDDYLARHLG